MPLNIFFRPFRSRLALLFRTFEVICAQGNSSTCIYTTPNSFRIREACCTVPVNRLSRPLFSVRVLARACSGTRTQGWPDHEKVDTFRHVNGTALELQRWHQPQLKKKSEEPCAHKSTDWIGQVISSRRNITWPMSSSCCYVMSNRLQD